VRDKNSAHHFSTFQHQKMEQYFKDCSVVLLGDFMSESVLITAEDRALLVKVTGLLEEIVETVNILEDKEAMTALKEAEADVKAGRVRDYDDFLKELRQTGEI